MERPLDRLHAPRRRLVCALAALAAGGLPLAARSQGAVGYPSRPIRILVMFPPGGGGDSQTRIVAEQLAPRLGQPIVVENRPGGGGIIAADLALKAPADGYTLLHAGATLMTLTPAFNSAARHRLDDFTPVASFTVAPPLLLATPDFRAHDLKALVAAAKQQPGKLSYGSWGLGSLAHVAGSWLDQRAGTQLTAIQYKGEVPVIQALMTGEIPLGWATVPAALPFLRAGKLKALGVASAQRVDLLPEVPTLIEQGLDDFVLLGWTGLFVPKATPREVVARLNAEVNAALGSAAVRDRLGAQGQIVTPLGSEEFGRMIRADTARLQPTLDALVPKVRE